MSSWGTSNGVSMWRSEWGNIRSLQEQLDEQVAASTSQQRRLSSQLSKLQGDLGQRVDRLSRAFDAFVELSDIRDALTVHGDARRWRNAAKQMVEQSIARDRLPESADIADLPDVAGYWLVPAVRALPGVVSGHPDAELLAEAARRDDVRSTLFMAAAAVMIARTDVVAGWVARAMSGSPHAPLGVGQRALWLAAADGEMAHTAVESVRSELRRRLDAIEAGATDRLVSNLATFPPGAAVTSTARSNATPSAATEMLRRWAAWCEQLTAAREVERPPSSPRAEPSAAPQPTVAGRGSDEVLSLVRALVEEGSDPEREMLDRAEALLRVVRGADAEPARDWHEPAGTVADLLVVDVRQTTEPARARFALGLLGDPIVAAADQLVTQSRVAPPATSTMAVGSRSVTIGLAGADPSQLADAELAVGRAAPRRVPAWSYAVIGLGIVLFAVLGAVAASGWFVLAALGAIVLVAVAAAERRNRGEAQRLADAQIQRLRVRVAEAVAELDGAAVAAAAAASESVGLRERIATSIAHARSLR